MGDAINGVLWGVDYYPEQWDKSYYEVDAKRMKEMGIKSVRLMEFAWTVIEPREGKYDFSLFDEIISIMAREGISTVLGTPTATFPTWLYEKDPNLLQISQKGIKRSFGTRREGCFNSRTYFEASMAIVEECAKHFASNPNIIGWQIDNEIGHEGSDICVCENCKSNWHIWLKNKYKTIDELNKLWGTVFWGTTYTRFEQIPVPKEEVATIQNPKLTLEYYSFASETAVKFVNSQIDIIEKYLQGKNWITTNLYPTPHSSVIDMDDITKNMDFASYDNYPIWGEQNEPMPYYFNSYVLSYVRGLNGKGNFGIMEQFTGIQGHNALGTLPHEKQVALWTNQAIARGANKLFYFRWRTAAFGQEQLCYGIFDTDNLETDRSKAIKKNILENYEKFDKFTNTPFEAKVCLLYDKENGRLLKDQYLSKGLYNKSTSFMQVGYDAELAKNFSPFVFLNVNADVVSVKEVDIKKYKLISLPLYQIVDEGFVKNLEKWVEDGGHLVLGYRTGTRDSNNHSIREALPGKFSKLAGVKIRKFESLNDTKVRMRMGFIPIKGEVWADIIECTTAKKVACYTDKNKHYKGLPSITVNDYGKGKVYYIGTSLNATALFFLYKQILKKSKLEPKFYGKGIEIVKRKTDSGKEVQVVLNHTKKSKKVKGYIIKPFEMKVLD